MRRYQLAALILFLVSGFLLLFAWVQNGRDVAGPLEPPSPGFDLSDLSLAEISLIVTNIVSLTTLVTTTIFRQRDEARIRKMHELSVAKTQLEIEKLRQEVDKDKADGGR